MSKAPAASTTACSNSRRRSRSIEAGEVHDFAVVPGLVGEDLDNPAAEDMLDSLDVGLAVGVDQAVEGAADLDLLFLRRLAAAAEDPVAELGQLGMNANGILEDVGNVPLDPQAHLDAAANPLKLTLEGAAVDPEDPRDGLRAVGNQAEGHRQDRVIVHQSLEHVMMRGELPPLGPDLLWRDVADDGRDISLAQQGKPRPRRYRGGPELVAGSDCR